MTCIIVGRCVSMVRRRSTGTLRNAIWMHLYTRDICVAYYPWPFRRAHLRISRTLQYHILSFCSFIQFALHYTWTMFFKIFSKHIYRTVVRTRKLVAFLYKVYSTRGNVTDYRRTVCKKKKKQKKKKLPDVLGIIILLKIYTFWTLFYDYKMLL